MLDDFLAIDMPQPEANAYRTMAILIHVFGGLGIPLNPDKTLGPVTQLQFLGVILDTVKMEVRLPADKVARILELLANFVGKRRCTKRHLLQLIGHLVFACRTCVPLRSFISRLLQASRSTPYLHYWIELDHQCKADTRMWQTLLNQWNGVCMFLDDEYSSLADLAVFTDSSSTVGFGGWYEPAQEYFKGTWEDHMGAIKKSEFPSMALLEIYPVAIACMIWGKYFTQKRIMFHCDNLATCQILNKGRSKCPEIMKIMRRLAMVAVQYNFAFRAIWLPSETNVHADALSRDNMVLFQMLAPSAQEVTCPAPSDMRFN